MSIRRFINSGYGAALLSAMLLAFQVLNALSTSHLPAFDSFVVAHEEGHSHDAAVTWGGSGDHQHHSALDHSHETLHLPAVPTTPHMPLTRTWHVRSYIATLSPLVFRLERPPKPLLV